jgi:hypothetical protein
LAFDKENLEEKWMPLERREKERLKAMSETQTTIPMPTKEEATGGFSKLVALHYYWLVAVLQKH